MSRPPAVRPLGLASFLLFVGCGGGSDYQPPRYPTSLTVACEPSSVTIGGTAQCSVSALDQHGQPLQNEQYDWYVNPPEVATVDAQGKVSTVRPGQVEVIAMSTGIGSGITGRSNLSVLETSTPRLNFVQTTCSPTSPLVGRTVRCTANAFDQTDQPFAVTRFTWSSSNEAIAKIDSDGRASILALGSVNLIATATVNGMTRANSTSLRIKSPTEHRGPLRTHETWRKDDSPHVVTAPLVVGGPQDPVLSLEPGVEVFFEAGAALMIGADEQNPGTLRVNGQEGSPVLFSARSDTPQPGHWAGVYFLRTSPAKGSRLSHTRIEYAGGALAGTPAPGRFQGGLNVLGGPMTGEPRTRVMVNQVEVRQSKEYGVVLGAKLTANSTRLLTQDNGKAGIVAAANAVGSIPRDSQFTNNGVGEALVWGGAVTESQTWPRLEVPYRLVSLVESLPAYVSVGSTANPLLYLEAGTQLLMPAGSAFLVGMSELGGLAALGAEGAPVQFVADTPTPRPGFWSGLHFAKARNSVLQHVQVSHAGARLNGTLGGGAVNVHEAGGFSMFDSTLRDSSGCGVSVAPSVTTDFSRPEYQNVFLNLAGENQCTQQ